MLDLVNEKDGVGRACDLAVDPLVLSKKVENTFDVNAVIGGFIGLHLGDDAFKFAYQLTKDLVAYSIHVIIMVIKGAFGNIRPLGKLGHGYI
jgi:hypothetical protein